MQKNEILMNRFPTVKADLNTAIKTCREASRLELLAKGQNRNMEDNKAFSKILQSRWGGGGSRHCCRTTWRARSRNLVSVVKRGTTGSSMANGVKVSLDLDPGAATAGLRSAIYTAASTPRPARTVANWTNQVQSLLFTPPPGQRSAIQIPQDEGIVSARGSAREAVVRCSGVDPAVPAGRYCCRSGAGLTDAALATFSRMLGPRWPGQAPAPPVPKLPRS